MRKIATKASTLTDVKAALKNLNVEVADLDPKDKVFCENLFNFTDASRFEN